MKKLLVLSMLGLAACSINSSPGDGDKIGQIVKIRKAGMFTKTWYAEIIRGGFTNSSGVNGTTFNFNIEGEALANQVKQYMESQQEVRITYRTEGVCSAFRDEVGGCEFLETITQMVKK